MDKEKKENPIIYKTTLTGEADEVQKIVMQRAFEHRDECIAAYCALPQSHGGTYINSDLFKEIFPEYSASNETRTKYDLAVHNSCAWLAQELFDMRAQDPEVKGCIFVTGVPGVGKSFFIQSLYEEGSIPEGYIVFEGNLCNLEASKAKFQKLQDNGKEIDIIVLSSDIKLAYENMLKRQQEIGRGATLFTMASIASKIKAAIVMLSKLFKIRDIGVYTKVGDNNNVVIQHGADAVKGIFDYNYEDAQSYLKSLASEEKGVVM